MEKEELQEKIVHPEIVAEVEKKMLSESEFEDLALLFKMFADSTRLKVLKALFEREMMRSQNCARRTASPRLPTVMDVPG